MCLLMSFRHNLIYVDCRKDCGLVMLVTMIGKTDFCKKGSKNLPQQNMDFAILAHSDD